MRSVFAFLIMFYVGIAACNSGPSNENLAMEKVLPSAPVVNGRLTTEKAKNALDRWNSNRGLVAMKGGGVREIPAQSAAIAEISVSNFTFNVKGGGTKTIASGNGTATFSHFTDGRWVLSKINIDDGWMNWSFEPNLNVN